VIVVIVFILVVVTLIFNRNGFVALGELREEIARVSGSIDSLETQISGLESDLERLSSDSVYMEQMVREILGWGREGEFIVRFVPPDSAGILH
jgi:hypothetical protein